MTLSILSQDLPKSIQKFLAKTNENEWAKSLIKRDKKGEDLTKLFNSIVNSASWYENPSLVAIAESSFIILRDKAPSLSLKAKKQFSKASQLFQTQTKTVSANVPLEPKKRATRLYTAKIEKEKTQVVLKKILSVWKKIAKQKNISAHNSDSITKEKKEVAEDSSLVIRMLRDCLQRKAIKKIPYIAYDEHFKVHGIALRKISKKDGQEIEHIAANPDNVVIFGNEKPTRGAGTALIRHIVQDIQANGESEDLHLDAYFSALPFYEKLGFEKKAQKRKSKYVVPMILGSQNMDTFLKVHALAGIIKSKEPSAKALAHWQELP